MVDIFAQIWALGLAMHNFPTLNWHRAITG